MKTKILILLFPLFLFAGAPPATNVGAMIAPTDSADIYGTHNSLWGRGGFREVLNTTARNAIPPLRRVMGMLVYCTADSTTYQLRGDTTNTSWQVYKLGKCVPDSAGKYPDSLFLKSLQVKTIYGHDSVNTDGGYLSNLNLRAKLIIMVAPGSNNKLWWSLDTSNSQYFYLTAQPAGTGASHIILAGAYDGSAIQTSGNWTFSTVTPDSLGGRTARFSGALYGTNLTLTGMSAAGFVENSSLGLLSTRTATQALGDIGALGLHATADYALDAGKVGSRAASYFLPSTAVPNGTAGVLAAWNKTGSDTLVGTNVTETGSLLYTTDSIFVNGRGIRTTSYLQGDTILWTKKLNADSSRAYDNRYAAKFTSGTANYFWGTPNGSAGVPSLRAFVAADLPNLGTVNTIAMFGTTGLATSAITQASGKLIGIDCTPAAGSTLAIGGTNAAVTIAFRDNPTVTDPYTYTPICSRVEFHSAGVVNVTLAAGSLAEGTLLYCTRDAASSYVIVNGHDLSGAHGGAVFIKTYDNGWQFFGN